jgi:hypothetical protein
MWTGLTGRFGCGRNQQRKADNLLVADFIYTFYP